MFGSAMLELAIGLIFFYLLLGLICTVVTEFILGWLDLRAKHLQQGIRTLLKERVLYEQFYQQPMIESLTIDGRLPSYIPPRSFALSILTLVTGSSSEYVSVHDIRQLIYSWTDEGATGSLKKVLIAMIDEAQGDSYQFRAALEFWFVSTMDQVASLFKRRVQWMVFAVALVFTVGANINTFRLAHYISEGPFYDWLAREEVASYNIPTPTPTPMPRSLSPDSLDEPTPSPYPMPRRDFVRYISPPELPIGWTADWRSLFATGRQILNLSIGWLITALAATLSALFWFDILSKFIIVRTAIKPSEKSQSGSNEGPRPPAGADSWDIPVRKDRLDY